MLERFLFWLSRDMTREEFGKWMLVVGVFGILLLTGIAMLGLSRLVFYLLFGGFLLVWLAGLLYGGLRGLEREEHNS